MKRAVISDFGGVLTTPLGHAFAAWSRESGIPLEDLRTALASAAERHGEHPLFMLEKGEIAELFESTRRTSASESPSRGSTS